MIERKDAAILMGKLVTLIGPELKAGERAPEFTVIDQKMNPLGLRDLRGRIKFIASVPSLDTSVCRKEAVRLQGEAERLMDDRAAWVVVSRDLPFAQRRFSEDEEIRDVTLASDYRDGSFGESYGVLIKDVELLSRALFVVDGDDVIRHVEYVGDNSDFPDITKAVSVVWDLLARMEKAA